MNLTYRGVSYQPQPRAYAPKKTNPSAGVSGTNLYIKSIY